MGGMRFTIYHGFAASLTLHLALGLPFALLGLAAAPDEPPMLVVELQGLIADSQTEQKVLQEAKGEAAERARPAEAAVTKAAADNQPPDVATDEKEAAPPPTPAKPAQNASPPAKTTSGDGGSRDIMGVEQRQNEQTIRADRDAEIDLFKDYVKRLTKKVQAKLIYPDEGRQAGWHGAATVSFAILANGQIRPETLRVAASSGQPKLDASALKTIRASAPFDPPPRETTVVIAVAFGRKR